MHAKDTTADDHDTQDHGKDSYAKRLGQVTDYGRSSAAFVNFRKGCVDGDLGVARRRRSAVYSGGDYLFYGAHGYDSGFLMRDF
ncbi:uncharacterized protein MYCFIDRAFT_213746 [Pseudocercospora fijiensis CIRAD86]|uniref:Uncharacterized protein n=1 Tax=Pseudocercospora fijiensis (strain CIRAD86) TaxID=383855 RepID=N1QCS6_PSEFD|nr:uncharacterized protein MYCFIDRAFT_213746 [Pseudocercospora fijiensis CIRAD86]EME89642.1 hypothetical protein MYCFIDRAFT_213746 [Pseudocercospora fijiensis CIRAD86]